MSVMCPKASIIAVEPLASCNSITRASVQMNVNVNDLCYYTNKDVFVKLT